MPRFRLTIEYDGTSFCGWQSQQNGVAVQQVVTEALRGFIAHEVTIFAAGRTDAGVHARGQVAHVDLDTALAPMKIRDAANFHLKPLPVAVLDVQAVADDFDARFSAMRRHYLYRIISRRAPPTLEAGRVWHVPRPLDRPAMQAAAARLVGRHDFTTFRAAQCQAKSPLRTLDRLEVSGAGAEVIIRATARSFLHNQVRSMVGALKQVGAGKWTADNVADALAARAREACPPLAPPCGLYLMQVDYAEAEK